MSFFYLALLLLSIFGITVLDWKYKLAWFFNVKRTAITVGLTMIVFVVWDILGIFLGIFFSGESSYTTGWYLGPEFPIEELFFLYLLTYFTLIVYRVMERRT